MNQYLGNSPWGRRFDIVQCGRKVSEPGDDPLGDQPAGGRFRSGAVLRILLAMATTICANLTSVFVINLVSRLIVKRKGMEVR